MKRLLSQLLLTSISSYQAKLAPVPKIRKRKAYVYHWDRILLASFAVVFVAVTLAYALRLVFVDQSSTDTVLDPTNIVQEEAPRPEPLVDQQLAVAAEEQQLADQVEMRSPEQDAAPEVSEQGLNSPSDSLLKESLAVAESKPSAPAVEDPAVDDMAQSEPPEPQLAQQEPSDQDSTSVAAMNSKASLSDDASEAEEATAMQSSPAEEPSVASDLSEAGATEDFAEVAPQSTMPSSSVPSSPQPASEVDASASPGTFREDYVDVVSEQISRFVLASGVNDLEPEGDLAEVEVPAAAAPKLYVFSDVRDMKDAMLHYVWKHEDQTIATVDVGVWSDRWRSYSSKFIEARMTGAWEVELRDQENNLLAKAGFTYSPNY